MATILLFTILFYDVDLLTSLHVDFADTNTGRSLCFVQQ